MPFVSSGLLFQQALYLSTLHYWKESVYCSEEFKDFKQKAVDPKSSSYKNKFLGELGNYGIEVTREFRDSLNVNKDYWWDLYLTV